MRKPDFEVTQPLKVSEENFIWNSNSKVQQIEQRTFIIDDNKSIKIESINYQLKYNFIDLLFI